MKKETLEEAIQRFYYEKGLESLAFEDGAKWQQEISYSEEDIKNAFLNGWELRDGDLPFTKAKNKWFEQFKKK